MPTKTKPGFPKIGYVYQSAPRLDLFNVALIDKKLVEEYIEEDGLAEVEVGVYKLDKVVKVKRETKITGI